jgi:hypothetical protein
MSQNPEKNFQSNGYYNSALLNFAIKRRGLSPEHLAILAKKSVTTTYLALKGMSTKMNTLRDLTDVLGIDYWSLFDPT